VTRPIVLEDVQRASTTEVQALLREGDAQARVWAAWVLGSRAPEGYARLLARSLAEEDHPGVRRHVLVVLAGAGRTHLLARAATADPDADVRATAVRLLARLAAPDDAAVYDLLCARAVDIAWQVRHAVADSIATDLLSIPADRQAPHQRMIFDRLVGMAFDPDPDVRAVVRARLERGDLPAAPARELLATLERVAATEARPRGGDDSPSRALVPYRAPLRLV
jgi:hypothetical protein